MTSIAARTLLTDFQLANPLYANGSVRVLVADTETWLASSTLATLYKTPAGTETHSNPVGLDGDGKFPLPVYVDVPVVLRVSAAQVRPHDTPPQGIQATFRGEWAADETYGIADIVRDGRFSDGTNKLYIAAVAHVSAAPFSADLVAGKWVLYVDSSTPVDYDDTIVAAATGFFFEDDGARVHRLNDRMFIGAVTANDGSSLGGGSSPDWFSAGTGISAGLSWVPYLSTVALVSANGTVGFSAASRASDVPSGLGTSQISIPFVGIAIMDRAGGGPPYWTAYGAYFEARMEPVAATTGTVIGIEIDAINFGSAAGAPTPSRMQTLGGTTALWLASGGDPSNHGRSIAPAQLAIGIVPNDETFEVGIAFHAEAIEGTDGTSGFGPAIRMATRHLIDWWKPGGSPSYGERVSFITSTNTVPGHSLQFQDNATLFVSAGGVIDFALANVASSVNGIGIVPAATGGTPYIESIGETNLDLKLWPKGTGNLALWCERVIFYNDSGHQMAGVLHSVTDDDYFNSLEFADGGPFFYGRGAIIAGFGQVANAVSHLSFSNAASGDPLSIVAQGSGDIDILLDPGGSNGTLRLALPNQTTATIGGASALPGVPAGYFKVKDTGGTSRVIPYWNP